MNDVRTRWSLKYANVLVTPLVLHPACVGEVPGLVLERVDHAARRTPAGTRRGTGSGSRARRPAQHGHAVEKRMQLGDTECELRMLHVRAPGRGSGERDRGRPRSPGKIPPPLADLANPAASTVKDVGGA
jgi:hypothetical protein